MADEDDLLARLRRGEATTRSAAETPSSGSFQQRLQGDEPGAPATADSPFDFEEPAKARQYRAYNTQRGVPSLEIRRVLGAWHSPYYPFLVNVSRDANHGRNFVLYFGFMIVHVDGENLQEISTAIRNKRCVYIQDFDPVEHDEPEKGQPVIRSIRYALKDIADALAEIDAEQTAAVMASKNRKGR